MIGSGSHRALVLPVNETGNCPLNQRPANGSDQQDDKDIQQHFGRQLANRALLQGNNVQRHHMQECRKADECQHHIGDLAHRRQQTTALLHFQHPGFPGIVRRDRSGFILRLGRIVQSGDEQAASQCPEQAEDGNGLAGVRGKDAEGPEQQEHCCRHDQPDPAIASEQLMQHRAQTRACRLSVAFGRCSGDDDQCHEREKTADTELHDVQHGLRHAQQAQHSHAESGQRGQTKHDGKPVDHAPCGTVVQIDHASLRRVRGKQRIAKEPAGHHDDCHGEIADQEYPHRVELTEPDQRQQEACSDHHHQHQQVAQQHHDCHGQGRQQAPAYCRGGDHQLTKHAPGHPGQKAPTCQHQQKVGDTGPHARPALEIRQQDEGVLDLALTQGPDGNDSVDTLGDAVHAVARAIDQRSKRIPATLIRRGALPGGAAFGKFFLHQFPDGRLQQGFKALLTWCGGLGCGFAALLGLLEYLQCLRLHRICARQGKPEQDQDREGQQSARDPHVHSPLPGVFASPSGKPKRFCGPGVSQSPCQRRTSAQRILP